MQMKFQITALALFFATLAFGQMPGEEVPKNWFNLDPAVNGVPGISIERTYRELLANKPSRTIVVAVLDTGVDYDHEDLKDVMWVNPGEIPGNGVDDDKNGYIDDIHGWNFIGNADGRNIEADNLEMTRLYVQYHAKYKDMKPEEIAEEDKKEYETYLEYGKKMEEKRAAAKPDLDLYGNVNDLFQKLNEAIDKDPKEVTAKDVNRFRNNANTDLARAASMMLNVMDQGNTYKQSLDGIGQMYDQAYADYNYYYNPEYDPRDLVGDNYEDPTERYYGNNDVEGNDARHGTHVAGIIGAVRKNGIGMDGVADNVRIMAVRMLPPHGDERDKDIANAIRYAVDNGATVINMSFGKGASPYKGVVDDAVKYAMRNDVLLIHAAGNDAKLNDFENNFPNDKFEEKGWFKPKFADNWLEIGAVGPRYGKDMVAGFSNYSGEIVDVFAPGEEIYATVPNNEYEFLQGTSMAAPVVAGIAAVLRSYYPGLSARQIKDVIMGSVVKEKEQVYIPGTEDLVSFSDICTAGGTVNAYKAVQLAAQIDGKRKKKYMQLYTPMKQPKELAIP
jgi:cell wall-associated protease